MDPVLTSKQDIHGILLLDKPHGITSNLALQKIKKIYRARKAGHTGSLDPIATGMLPICFGEATKFSQFLLNSDKRYRVTAKLGIKTTTGDTEGDIISQSDVVDVTTPDILKAMQHFQGKIQQIPPMYSALKIQGQPLYVLARQGKEVERKAREITIYSIEFSEYLPGEHCLTFEVYCSKGTYIRTLVEDIGELLGCGAHVIALHRLFVTPYQESSMISLNMLNQIAAINPDELKTLLLPVEAAVVNLPTIQVNESDSIALKKGQAVIPSQSAPQGMVKLVSTTQDFLGIGEVIDATKLIPRRLLAN